MGEFGEGWDILDLECVAAGAFGEEDAGVGLELRAQGGGTTGVFGQTALEKALEWIRTGVVHFVASDAHNNGSRPLRLKPAYEVVEEQFGKEKARVLFLENPLAAFEGRELPHVPEVEEEEPERKRKRFFFF